jgi:hypothetical protein
LPTLAMASLEANMCRLQRLFLHLMHVCRLLAQVANLHYPLKMLLPIPSQSAIASINLRP